MSRSNNSKRLPSIAKPTVTADFVRQAPKKKFEFQDVVTIEAAVYQALGAASVCWSKKPQGTFMTERISEVGEALLKEIRDWYED